MSAARLVTRHVRTALRAQPQRRGTRANPLQMQQSATDRRIMTTDVPFIKHVSSGLMFTAIWHIPDTGSIPAAFTAYAAIHGGILPYATDATVSYAATRQPQRLLKTCLNRQPTIHSPHSGRETNRRPCNNMLLCVPRCCAVSLRHRVCRAHADKVRAFAGAIDINACISLAPPCTPRVCRTWLGTNPES